MKIYEQKASGYVEEVKEGYNGWAFLFGPLWYLHVGMFGKAILLMFAALAISLFFSYVTIIIFWCYIGAVANRNYEDHLINKGYTVVRKKSNKNPNKWECENCEKRFATKKSTENHEKRCKA
jgi:hypothetical protein